MPHSSSVPVARLTRILAVAALATLAASPARAQASGDTTPASRAAADTQAKPRPPLSFILAAGAGYYHGAESRSTGPWMPGAAVRLGVPLARYLALEPGAALMWPSGKSTAGAILVPEVQLQVPFGLDTGVGAHLGLGYARFGSSPSPNRDAALDRLTGSGGGATALSASLGLRVPLRERVALRIDGRGYLFGLDGTFTQWTAGLAWRP